MTLEEQLKQTPAFSGRASFLSNFASYEKEEYFNYRGIFYHSNEHFYQAMKFESPNIRYQIARHPSIGLKKFVRTLGPIREDWDEIKLEVMEEGLRYKFSLPRFKWLLLSTHNLELVEYNYWGDTFWGVCKGVGENNLGKLLMKIRSELDKP